MSLRSLSVLVAATGALAAGVGCSDHKTTPPGKACIINSDCNNPLSCSFGKCHEACRANGDCPGGGRCVWTGPASADGGASADSVRVCLLEHECTQNSGCLDPLVCGRDLECRNECEADRDCPNETDRCVIGGPNGEKVCAEPDRVDPGNGELKPPADAGVGDGVGTGGHGGAGGTGGGGGTGGSGGTSGAAGAGGSVAGGAAGASAAAGKGGAAGTGGSAGGAGGTGGTAGAAGTTGTAGAAGTGGSVSGAGGTGGLTIIPEVEPNNDQAQAAPYIPGTQVMATSVTGDEDYFALTAPPGDLSGGYYQLRITNVGAGYVHLVVYSKTDNGRIGGTDGADAGESSFFYWAALPGQIYYVRTYGGGSTMPFAYTFTVSYTKVDDPYEPNNDRESPKPIPLGQMVTAYFFSGFAAAIASVDEDWYSIDLAAGPATATLTSVATNERLLLDLVNDDFESTRLGSSVSMGSNVNAPFTVPTAGKYSIVVKPQSFVALSQQGASMTVIDSFTRPYKLVVTQP
jgi:hypothetical protein